MKVESPRRRRHRRVHDTSSSSARSSSSSEFHASSRVVGPGHRVAVARRGVRAREVAQRPRGGRVRARRAPRRATSSGVCAGSGASVGLAQPVERLLPRTRDRDRGVVGVAAAGAATALGSEHGAHVAAEHEHDEQREHEHDEQPAARGRRRSTVPSRSARRSASPATGAAVAGGRRCRRGVGGRGRRRGRWVVGVWVTGVATSAVRWADRCPRRVAPRAATAWGRRGGSSPGRSGRSPATRARRGWSRGSVPSAVERAGGEPDRHPGRDAERARHHRVRARELHAEAALVVQELRGSPMPLSRLSTACRRRTRGPGSSRAGPRPSRTAWSRRASPTICSACAADDLVDVGRRSASCGVRRGRAAGTGVAVACCCCGVESVPAATGQVRRDLVVQVAHRRRRRRRACPRSAPPGCRRGRWRRAGTRPGASARRAARSRSAARAAAGRGRSAGRPARCRRPPRSASTDRRLRPSTGRGRRCASSRVWRTPAR